MDVSLICPPAWDSQKFEKIPANSEYNPDKNVDVRILPVFFNGKNHFHFYRGLEKTMASLRPDIVNIEEEHYSIVTWQSVRAALKIGAKPLFYTWQNIHKNYPPPFNLIENYVFAHAYAAVTGNSEATEILRKKGFTKTVCEIPQMGVDIDRFAPSNSAPEAKAAAKKHLGLNEGEFWIGFAGRLVEEKGIHDLVRALFLIPEKLNARLAIIGSGPQRAALDRHLESIGILNKVRFVDFVESSKIPGWLQALDVLCLPSLTRSNWKEQFGRILIESMAAGTVVVGSSSGEIPKVVGAAGRIFKESDYAALGQILTELASSPSLCADLRKAGSERVRRLYTSEVIANAFADLFHTVAALPKYLHESKNKT